MVINIYGAVAVIPCRCSGCFGASRHLQSMLPVVAACPAKQEQQQQHNEQATAVKPAPTEEP